MTPRARQACAAAALVLTLGACSPNDAGDASPGANAKTSAAPLSPSPWPSRSEQVPTVLELADGPLAPGRYRHVLTFECEEGDTISCPSNPTTPRPIEFEITVPDEWEAAIDFRLLYPGGMGGLADEGGATNAPDGGGLVVGWTNFHVGLNSDPCARNHNGHLVPDIPVGPTVDDFVEAVVDHPTLDISEPTDVHVGRFRGRFFTLTGPSDISACDDWRPWDPGFYVQGPKNLWDVWALDIAGTRIVVVAQYFPGTPDQIVTDLTEMVRSIRFRP